MAYNRYDKMRAEAPRNYKDFESKFEARIEDSKEYRQYVRRMPYNMWDGKIPFDTEVEVVPMKSIHLTIDNLERLVRQQDRMEQLEDDAEYGKKVVRMLREDERVRDDNPAVAKAYRNYLTLLEIARN
jgi:abortive infection bacteriophage resistance protein